MKDVEPRARADAGTGPASEGEPTLVSAPSSASSPPTLELDPMGEDVTRVRLPESAPLPRDPSPPRATGVFSVAPGLTLAGRYTVLKLLGRGGMGEVVSAYDSRLDRRVALKRLRRESASRQSQEDLETRLVREAQAMARLSHPHVVAIYDVGTLEDGAIFIAMEMVEGQTLRQWCDQSPRPWREVLQVYLAAGRGLAAAHEAGLVHRDFKPENVLVGSDGRVRVTDFGLARVGPSASPERPAETPRDPGSGALPPGALDNPLTLQGTLLGTPRFMAPELLQAGAADARSDLFAFCVALHEALYGQHPFAGATQAESLQAQVRGQVKPPPTHSDVPAWVGRTLQQGLRADPAQRPASMQKLVAALEDDPEARRRTRRRALGLLVLGSALTALVLGVVLPRLQRESGCAHLERSLAGTWDEPVRQQVERAFLDTQLPYARDTFTRVASLLDGYASTWVSLRTAACEAARSQDASAQVPTSLEVYCLERRRGQLQELTGLFARAPDPDNLSKAVQAVQGLPPLTACADPKALTSTVPLPGDPTARARVEALQVRVDRLETLKTAGQYKTGLASGRELLPQLEQVDYAPLRAQVLLNLAALSDAAGDYAGAEAGARQAILQAARGKDLTLVARAWTLLFRDVVWRQARYPEEPGLTLAMESAVECADNDELRADALNQQAIVYQEMGRNDEALARHERALALREKTLGAEHLLVANSLNNLGVVFGAMGQNEQARAAYERALALRRKILGPNHPLVGQSYSNLGTALVALGRYDEARDLYEHALALRKQALGLEHPEVASSLTNLGIALEDLGRYDEALVLHERSLAIRQKALGPDHPDTANSLNGVGNALWGQGHPAEARVYIERALAIREKTQGADHPDVASTRDDLGQVLVSLHRADEARASYTRALAIRQKALGAEHPDLAISLNGLGNALHEQGRDDEARVQYELALALREKALGPTHPLVGEVLANLGRCLARLKQWEQAVPRLERALTLLPETRHPEVRALLERARAATPPGRGERTALAPVP